MIGTSKEDLDRYARRLEEMRVRLIVCAVAVGVGFVFSYFFKEKFFQVLIQPLHKSLVPGQKLVFMSLPEAFFSYLKVSFLFGIVFALPVLMYELWTFLAPGLVNDERRVLLWLVPLSCAFFAAGVSFGFFVALPFAFDYLMKLGSDVARPVPRMKEYVSLASTLLLAFGLIFELPLILTMLARIGMVSRAFLQRNRKYAVLLIFIAAAILTPTPDVLNQFLMAGPLMVLYELSILGIYMFGKKREAHRAEGVRGGAEVP
jgi:sec-independent protein translocase protein TatC